ncbi:NAD(P)H-dependent oxidoreductase [Caldicellulosiruptor naganoensis]|uniref:NAD(P)H-dependent oxidoreductase n=1 Tax=Caldicellulosiruptor naganoensis TaxID=29324 RepID=A0ABY7BNF0_9FIRM|nr:NAD(P)H-dependent oxidoreductase [Caldicellulosiruptor naganoensis]WAM32551.1 NAD(P)H-dependent oxidoreductase [Caldicellulosiruptor naganoensis]
MKVIGIISSLRKDGNTQILVESVLEGSKQAGAEIEVYRLNDLKFTWTMLQLKLNCF